jgi:hypothetical protein
MKTEWWGCTTGSRKEVPGERKLVIRDDDDDDDDDSNRKIINIKVKR